MGWIEEDTKRRTQGSEFHDYQQLFKKEVIFRNMSWIDMAIAVVILGATLLGLRMGLLRAAFLLGSFILGIAISTQVSALLDNLLQEIIKNQDVRDLVTFTGAFVLIFIGVNLLGSIICKAVSFTPLRWADQWIGGALGFLTGVLLVGLAIMYLSKSPISGSEELLTESFLVPIIRTIVIPIFRQFLEKESALPTVVFSRMMWQRIV